jgi:GMP synthase (glutamine-hydrolysing)
MQKHDYILILDYGSQVTQLIARRIRELNVFCEIHPFSLNIEKIKELNPKGIILSGGPMSVYDENAPLSNPAIFDLGIPILGICYGMQFMALQQGGSVERSEKREFGHADIIVDSSNHLFNSMEREQHVWMSHGDHVVSLPEGFNSIAQTDNCPFAAIADVERQQYGVQFHPEVVHTPQGKEILQNFLVEICKVTQDWTISNFVSDSLDSIKKLVGNSRVVMGLSGGVDSSVAAMLISEAIGKNLVCIFVDNGLLRKSESEKVMQSFAGRVDLNIIRVDASERFLEKLAGVTDPDQKRKIIGHEFVEVFVEEAAKLGSDFDFLGQGTLYPDVIESVSVHGPAVTIKRHHNVGGLPEKMKLKLVEPLRFLFKDEVRELGRELGLPEDLIKRQPFPGPGLAVRLLGEITRERLDILREADDIIVSEVKNAGLYDDLWQSFGVLLPIKSVGVMGDSRTYEDALAVRAVESVDAMTANWAELPYDLLRKISSRIINEVRGINRVVYDISSKPPSTIEWE